MSNSNKLSQFPMFHDAALRNAGCQRCWSRVTMPPLRDRPSAIQSEGVTCTIRPLQRVQMRNRCRRLIRSTCSSVLAGCCGWHRSRRWQPTDSWIDACGASLTPWRCLVCRSTFEWQLELIPAACRRSGAWRHPSCVPCHWNAVRHRGIL